MRPLQPVTPGARMALGVGFFVLFFVVWGIATLGGFISKTFLADPITMVKSGYDLLVNQGFIKDIAMTVWRVLGGFAVAALLASGPARADFIPLGDLPGGAFISAANGVSADGAVVVGFSNSASGGEAFRWTSGGGLVGLGGSVFGLAGGGSSDLGGCPPSGELGVHASDATKKIANCRISPCAAASARRVV